MIPPRWVGVDRQVRTIRRQSARVRLGPGRHLAQSRYPLIQIDVTVIVPHRPWWLLTGGFVLGNFGPPDRLLDIAYLVLRALITD